MIGKRSLSAQEWEQALKLCRRIALTLQEQSVGWKERSIFERQWLKRAFAKRAGMPVEAWLDALAAFYTYLHEMGKGAILDPEEREEQLAIVKGWEEDARFLAEILEEKTA